MLDIAMALRLKGIASNEHIAEITGKGQSDVDDVLNMMQEKLYAQETPRGLRLLPEGKEWTCLLYTSPSPRDVEESRMPSSA